MTKRLFWKWDLIDAENANPLVLIDKRILYIPLFPKTLHPDNDKLIADTEEFFRNTHAGQEPPYTIVARANRNGVDHIGIACIETKPIKLGQVMLSKGE